jgi:hypothetical protein
MLGFFSFGLAVGLGELLWYLTHPHVGRGDAPFIICAQGVQQLSSSLAVPNPHLFQCYKVVL